MSAPVLNPLANPKPATAFNPSRTSVQSTNSAPAVPSIIDTLLIAMPSLKSVLNPKIEIETPVNKRPVSDAQINANRQNAQLSTGAKTEAGRLASSQNRFVHGLARHNGYFKLTESESEEDWFNLRASLIHEHNPQTPTEGILVHAMAESHWLACRAHTLQSHYMGDECGNITDEKQFNLYGRYYAQHTRAFHKALNDLLKLRAAQRAGLRVGIAEQTLSNSSGGRSTPRPDEANGFEAQKPKPSPEPLASKRNPSRKPVLIIHPDPENPPVATQNPIPEVQKNEKPPLAA